jgi:hypothetical protein
VILRIHELKFENGSWWWISFEYKRYLINLKEKEEAERKMKAAMVVVLKESQAVRNIEIEKSVREFSILNEIHTKEEEKKKVNSPVEQEKRLPTKLYLKNQQAKKSVLVEIAK